MFAPRRLNGLGPEAYLREVIGHTADHPINRIAALLPWNIGLCGQSASQLELYY